LISYELQCIFCKQPFHVIEGTRKYNLYKRNMNGRFSCEDCDRKIEHEARKSLLRKL